MSFVPQEANWSAQTGASVPKSGFKPKQNGAAERSNHLAVRPLLSRAVSGEESPTTEIAAGIAEAHGVIVVAVTVDQELRDALTEMLPKGSLVFADSPEQVLSRPVPSQCGVLIVEHVLKRPLFEELKSYLKASAPALVNIMVGTQNDGSMLIGLLSAGCIDRFMVKPLRAGPARNALRSALQEHHSLRSIVRADRDNPQVTRSDTPSDRSKDSHKDESSIFETVAARKIVAPKVIEKALQPVARLTPSIAKPITDDSQSELTNVNDWLVEHSGQPKVDKSRVSQPAVGTVKARRKFSPYSWAFTSAALIAVSVAIAVVLVPWRTSTRTQESKVTLDVNKVIAGHLSAAKKALELGSYVDPPELSAVHFYAAALELDPKNLQAKQGLDAVADGLIADSKKLIAAGDLLRAQSELDSVRRLQPTHRELTEVIASLLAAREAERLTLNAAQTNAELIKDEKAAMNPTPKLVASMTPAAASVVAKPSGIIDPKTKKAPQRQERVSQATSSDAGKSASALANKAPPTTQVANVTVANVNGAAAASSSPSVSPQSVRNAPLEPVPDDVALRAAPKIAAVPDIAVTEQATPTTIPTTIPTISAPVSAGSVSTSGPTTDTPRGFPSLTNGEFRLIKYVPPVFPYTERTESRGGWLDVQFFVTSDGSVINPRIKDGELSAKFHRAAVAAVSKWKFAPAPNSVKSDRPATVRITFRLAE